MKKHLAIFSSSVINAIFSGQKIIDSRFSKHKIAPFLQVSSGDVVYIKEPGNDIIGQFIVKKVLFIDGLNEDEFDQLEKQYWAKISWNNEKEERQFKKEKREEAKYATLIWIAQLERFLIPPIKIPKRDNRGWMVLD